MTPCAFPGCPAVLDDDEPETLCPVHEGSGTTLDLADAIARAVLAAASPAGNEPYGGAPAQAVLRVLREAGLWFCRLEETAQGTTYQRMPDVQGELFR